MNPDVTFNDPQDARDLLCGRIARLKSRRLALINTLQKAAHTISRSVGGLNADELDTALRAHDDLALLAGQIVIALGDVNELLDAIDDAKARLAALATPKE